MKSFTYYHNPRCSKSRQGLALLEENDVKLQVKLYLTEKLSIKEIEDLLKATQMNPLEGAIRKNEEAFKELGLKDKNLSLKEWAKVIISHPVLLERPILFDGKRAVIGRPPEELLTLIP